VQRYQLSNNIESATLELDENAQIISYEEYYPYGDTSYMAGKSESEVSQKRYRYTGKEKDEESGLYYYGARYYSSMIGIFISVDPKLEKYPNVSSYAYCMNNPVKLIDPNGEDWILSTGDKVHWYGGDYGNKSDLIDTFNARSGYKDTKTGENYQMAKYQGIANRGPTVEGEYELNLTLDPNRDAIKIKGEEKFERGSGIEQIPTEYLELAQAWGSERIRLEPVLPHEEYGNEDRDIESFYFHSSYKDSTHGCIEVEERFFDKLKEYRNEMIDEGNEDIKIKVMVEYPDPEHITRSKFYGEDY
jgi:RHS repeat-associated protein